MTVEQLIEQLRALGMPNAIVDVRVTGWQQDEPGDYKVTGMVTQDISMVTQDISSASQWVTLELERP